jgi:hypothetical protein
MASLTRAVGRRRQAAQARSPARPAAAEPPSTAVLPRIAEDGGQGDETYGAIEEFQRRVMKLKKPDGRVVRVARPGRPQPAAAVVVPDAADRQPRSRPARCA